jgi:hypothetical protein
LASVNIVTGFPRIVKTVVSFLTVIPVTAWMKKSHFLSWPKTPVRWKNGKLARTILLGDCPRSTDRQTDGIFGQGGVLAATPLINYLPGLRES